MEHTLHEHISWLTYWSMETPVDDKLFDIKQELLGTIQFMQEIEFQI